MISVTTVLGYHTDPDLLKWIENNSKAKRKAISDEAIRIGRASELLVQQDIKEGGYLVPEGDTGIENCMKAWEKFKNEHENFISSVSAMQTEITKGDIVGHPDFIIGESGIIDLKCSSYIRPLYWTQVAKYSDILGQKAPRAIGILRLDKKSAKYEYRIISDEDYISYEIKVFEAYYVAFQHSAKNREVIRQQLELETLGG